MSKKYDAILIGSGQANSFLVGQLADSGKKVAFIEANKIGGSCINYGCVPSKTIIASARVAYLARRGTEYGIEIPEIKVDINAVIDRKQRRVDDAFSGMNSAIRGHKNIDVYDGYAAFDGSEGSIMHRVKVNDQILMSSQVFINTGTYAFIAPIEGLDKVDYLTNEGILNLREVPEHLLVLGGGYIGLEMAQAWRRFGARVTVIEQSSRLLMREDEDISEAVLSILQNEGIDVLMDKSAQRVSESEGQITVEFEDKTSIRGSHLLVAIGRKPAVEKLNLESVSVKLNERGYIDTDKHLRTNVEGIYALGDVNGRGAFTHTAYQDYEIVWDNLQGGKRQVDRNMSYVMYIDPPLGRTGLSEKEARESGRKVLMATKPMREIGRALEQGETQGLIKLLVDAESERIIGAAVLGYHGDDVIQVLSYFMATDAPYQIMQEALPIHPTISELLPTILGELKPL